MSYRYPFTPFPRGWYRIVQDGDQPIRAFGKRLIIEKLGNELILKDINSSNIFPMIKKNGYLFACYHAIDNLIPNISEFQNEQWQKPFRLYWKTRVHVQEVVENALDMAHFCTVHTYKIIPTISNFNLYGTQFSVTMHSEKNVFGKIVDTNMEITYYGMGIVIANVTTNTGIILKVFLTTTPITEELVEIRMDVAIKKTSNPVKNFILKTFLPSHIKKEFTRDIPVWEAKIYRKQPILCQAERNIVRIRKWASQFYA